jgi:hypothetical protein
MSQHHDQEQTLRISSEGTEFVNIQLESSSPAPVRLQLDGGCIFQHENANRPGSYVDGYFGPR